MILAGGRMPPTPVSLRVHVITKSYGTRALEQIIKPDGLKKGLEKMLHITGFKMMAEVAHFIGMVRQLQELDQSLSIRFRIK